MQLWYQVMFSFVLGCLNVPFRKEDLGGREKGKGYKNKKWKREKKGKKSKQDTMIGEMFLLFISVQGHHTNWNISYHDNQHWGSVYSSGH